MSWEHEHRRVICTSEHNMSSLAVLSNMCSRFISAVLEGGYGSYHSRGICVTWLPYFPVTGIANQLRKESSEWGKARWGSTALSSSAGRSCLAACAPVVNWNYAKETAWQPPQGWGKDHNSKINDGPGKEHGKQLATCTYNTSRNDTMGEQHLRFYSCC